MTATTLLSDNGVSSGVSGYQLTGGNDGTLQLQTATSGGTATTAVTIDNSQNVGIGTSSPSTPLHVVGTTRVARTGTPTQYADISCTATTGFNLNVSAASGAITMSTDGGTTRMVTLDGYGNVGIGASSPRGLLDLNTTRSVKAYWGTAGTLGETQNAAGDYIGNSLYVSAESAGTMTYTKTTNDAGNAIIQDFSRGITFYTGATGNAATTGTLNNFERARIDASGNTLTVTTSPTYGNNLYGIPTAYIGFGNTSWADASFTARGALIYNSSKGDKSVAVLDFGADKTVSGTTFTIQFPTADANSAIVRIS